MAPPFIRAAWDWPPFHPRGLGLAPPFILSLSKDERGAGVGAPLVRGVGVLAVAEAADVGFLVEQLAEAG